jgi:hypothetical protein
MSLTSSSKVPNRDGGAQPSNISVLAATPRGLTSSEARSRLDQIGANAVADKVGGPKGRSTARPASTEQAASAVPVRSGSSGTKCHTVVSAIGRFDAHQCIHFGLCYASAVNPRTVSTGG